MTPRPALPRRAPMAALVALVVAAAFAVVVDAPAARAADAPAQARTDEQPDRQAAPAEVAGAQRPTRPPTDGTPSSRRVLVGFEDRVTPAAADAALRAHGVSPGQRFARAGVTVGRVDRGRDPTRAAAALARRPDVAYAEPDRIWRPTAITSDPLVSTLWGLDNVGQVVDGVAGTEDVDVDAPEAWTTTRGDGEVLVAVIDTGIDLDHPDLADRIWTNPDETPGNGVDDDGNGYVDDVHGWDFANDDASVFDPVDGDDHGTHVAGTIAATADNALGVAGVAPEVTILPLKFIGGDGVGYTSDAIAALEYAAAEGALVTNNSWGGDGESQALSDAIAELGLLVVAAAGNSGRDTDSTPTYPASYPHDNIVSVAAVTNTGALASFSNFGETTVDLGAPGVDVLSTLPHVDVDTALEVDGGDYRAVVWGFGLEDVVGAGDRAGLVGRAGAWLGGLDQPVLVVDDDQQSGSLDTAGMYVDALADAGATDVTVHTVGGAEADGPDLATLSGNLVVWETGWAWGTDTVPTLTAADRAALVDFLDGGGRLLLAGPDALYRSEDSTLVADRLDATVVAEGDVATAASGLAGSHLEGADYDVSGTDSPFGVASSYRDHLAPTTGLAQRALRFPALTGGTYGLLSGTSMAAPHVSGVAALVASLAPTVPAADLAALLRDTTEPLASLDGKTVTGGMVDADGALASVADVQPPGRPRDVSAAAGDERAEVSWSPPADDGGSPLTGYTVTASPGGATVDVDADTTTTTVAGLDNGTGYTFTVTAHNAEGSSLPSEPSNEVVPVGPPGAPTDLAASPGDGKLTTTWSEPTDLGGGTLTGWQVEVEPGGATATLPASQRSYTASGLENGTDHRLHVAATTDVATGPAAAGPWATPRATPDAPRDVTASPGSAELTVSWSAPADDGGAAVTGYEVHVAPAGITREVSASRRSLVVDGLENGLAHDVAVRAVNAAGDGARAWFGPTTPELAPPVRLAGANRHATAAAISAATFEPGVPVAYVATGSGFPDALAGSAAAARAGGPVLLVDRDGVPDETAAELQRLAPGRVVVLGGELAVSGAVADRLGALTGAPVSRLAGADRFTTAATISAATFDPGVPVVYLATGRNFPDALGAGAAAGRAGGAVLLVERDRIPPAVAAELSRLRPERVAVLGGSAVVGDAVVDTARRLTGAAVTRLGGTSRYATSALISQDAFPSQVGTVFVATGAGFPDALAGGPAAATTDAPVVLVPPTAPLPETVAAELARLAPARVRVLGGSAALSDAVVEALHAAAG